jgi:hypothetical protein
MLHCSQRALVKPIDLANIPNNLLRVGDCLALGLGALGP